MLLRRGLIPLLATSALLLAACAGDDAGGAAGTTTTTTSLPDETERSVDDAVVERVAEAAERTAEEGTARLTIEVETAGTGMGDGRQPIAVDGEVDFEAEQRRLGVEGPEGTLDVIIDGDVAYVELPATEGDDWLRIDLAELLDDDLGFGGPAGIPFQDPRDNLRVLGGSALHAQEVGEEQVDGTSTTHYELVIDLRDAATEASDEVQDAVTAVADATGADELAMEVWIDDDDLIHRVAYTLDLDEAEVRESEEGGTVEADPRGTVTVTIEYRDHGEPVDIEVPDDDQVIDLDEDAVRDAIGGGGSGATTTTTTSGTGDTTTTTARDGTTTSTTAATTTTG